MEYLKDWMEMGLAVGIGFVMLMAALGMIELYNNRNKPRW